MEAHRTSADTARVLDARLGDLKSRARAAAAVAAKFANQVDAEARFPHEAFAEIRKQELLGIMVPTALDGEGASLAEIVDVCFVLGQSFSATAMIYAMHQIKMACIVRHTNGSATLEAILRRIATEQLLMASSTTEGTAGGNVRASEAPVEHDGDHYMFSPNTQMQKDIWLSDAGHLLKGGKEEALKMLRWYCFSCRTVQTP